MFPFALFLNAVPSQHKAEFIAIIGMVQVEHNRFPEVFLLLHMK